MGVLLAVMALAGCDPAGLLPFGGPAPASPGAERLPVIFLTHRRIESLPPEEAAAWAWATAEPGLDARAVELVDLEEARVPDDAVLWWHYAEEPALPSAAVRGTTMARVRQHLDTGGGVLLTLMATPWVVPLGLESAPPDRVGVFAPDAAPPARAAPAAGADAAPAAAPPPARREPSRVDLGLQAAPGHPALRRFWGGAYTTVGVADHGVAGALYTVDRWPVEGRVWAVQRQGDRVEPTVKVGIEYPPAGDRAGRLVAAGAHLHFAATAAHRVSQLHGVVLDLLRHAAGRPPAPPPGTDAPPGRAVSPASGATPPAPGAGGADRDLPSGTGLLTPEVHVLEATRHFMPLPVGGPLRGAADGAAPGPVADGTGLVAGDGATAPGLAGRIELAVSGPALSSVDPGSLPFAVTGPRAAAIGRRDGAVAELWTHPLRVARELRFGIVRPGRPVRWLDDPGGTRTFTLRPEGAALALAEADLEVDVRLTVGLQRAALVAVITVRAADPVGLVATWHPDAGIGWPEGRPLAPLRLSRDPSTGVVRWRDRHGEVVGAAGFRRPPAAVVLGFDPAVHLGPEGLVPPSEEGAEGAPLPAPAAAVQVRLDDGGPAVFVLAGGAAGGREVDEARSALLRDPAGAWERRAADSRRALGGILETRTSQPRLDTALRWLSAGLVGARVAVPGFGAGILESLEPGVAPGVGAASAWAAMAADAVGAHAIAAETLRTLARYRGIDGRIPGRASTARQVRQTGVEATLAFLLAVDEHTRVTGDRELLGFLGPAVDAAVELMSRDVAGRQPAGVGAGPRPATAADGAPSTDAGPVAAADLARGGAAADDAPPTLSSVETSIEIGALEVAAHRAAARLARWRQDDDAAAALDEMAARLRERLNAELWDPGARYFRAGWSRDGGAVPLRTILPAVPLALGLLPPGEATALLEPFAGPGLNVDWGVRVVDDPEAALGPDDPAPGAVRPAYTAWTAWAEYAAHRPVPAWSHLARNLELVVRDGTGTLPQALEAGAPTPAAGPFLDVRSHALTLLALVRGTLGIRPDALAGTLEVRPHLPAGWTRVEIDRVRVGDTLLRLSIDRAADRTTYGFERLSGDGPFELTIGAAVPPDVLVNFDPAGSSGVVPVSTERIDRSQFDAAAVVTVTPTAPLFVVAFRHGPYPEVIVRPGLADAPTAAGDLRLTGTTYRAGRLVIVGEGLPGHSYAVRLTTPWRLAGVSGVPGARIAAQGPGEATIEMTIPGGGDRYRRVELEVSFRIP